MRIRYGKRGDYEELVRNGSMGEGGLLGNGAEVPISPIPPPFSAIFEVCGIFGPDSPDFLEELWGKLGWESERRWVGIGLESVANRVESVGNLRGGGREFGRSRGWSWVGTTGSRGWELGGVGRELGWKVGRTRVGIGWSRD